MKEGKLVERVEQAVEEQVAMPMPQAEQVGAIKIDERLLARFNTNRDKVIDAEIMVGRLTIQSKEIERALNENIKEYQDGQKGLRAAHQQMQEKYGPGQINLEAGTWHNAKPHVV